MKAEDWNKLKLLPENTEEFAVLLEETMKEEEHPEDYDGPCMCKLCQSYGD